MFFVHIVFELVNEEGEDSIDVSGNKICIYGVKLKRLFHENGGTCCMSVHARELHVWTEIVTRFFI